MQTTEVNNVVVRLPNWLGDVAMSVQALRELRSVLPRARITLVSRPGASDVFLEADFCDEVLIYEHRGLPSTLTQIRAWRKRRFDLAILFQNAFEAAAISFLARVRRRVGYDTQGRGFLLTHAVPLPDWRDKRHESFYYLNLVTEVKRLSLAGSNVANTSPNFALKVSDRRKSNARRLLKETGVAIDSPVVVLCPGSINSRAKRWPAERYAALANELMSSRASVVLIGSPAELEVSREVYERSARKPILLTGKTTVAEAIAIIGIADLLITNDTGPAHLGAALNTPTLAIFGPTNPLTTYPFSAAAEIIRHPPDCAPCMLRDCPIDHRCMTAISVKEVFERAAIMLSHRSTSQLQTA